MARKYSPRGARPRSRFCVLRHLSIIREFLNGPRPPGGSSASAEPPHSPADRTQTAHTRGRTAQRYRRTNRHKRYRRTHGGDRGWRWVQHERETVRRPTSHERAVRVLAAPSGRARVACIFRLTARVRLLAPSAPVSGLAPAQIPPKGRLGPLREDKSGFCQKSRKRTRKSWTHARAGRICELISGQ